MMDIDECTKALSGLLAASTHEEGQVHEETLELLRSCFYHLCKVNPILFMSKEARMVYSKGHKMIGIEYKPLFGNKRPVLIIGEGLEMPIKVACFGSVEKAKKFEEWLRDFFGDRLVKEPNNKEACE